MTSPRNGVWIRYVEIASNDKQARIGGRRSSYFWHFLALGLVGGGAVIAFAFLPRSLTGFVSLVKIGMWTLIGFLSRRFARVPFSTQPRKGAVTVVYSVILGIVLVGAFVLDFFVVRRGDLPWLAWVMAGVIVAVSVSAVWLADGTSAPKIASAK